MDCVVHLLLWGASFRLGESHITAEFTPLRYLKQWVKSCIKSIIPTRLKASGMQDNRRIVLNLNKSMAIIRLESKGLVEHAKWNSSYIYMEQKRGGFNVYSSALFSGPFKCTRPVSKRVAELISASVKFWAPSLRKIKKTLESGRIDSTI